MRDKVEEMSVAEEEIALWLTSPAFFINLNLILVQYFLFFLIGFYFLGIDLHCQMESRVNLVSNGIFINDGF